MICSSFIGAALVIESISRILFGGLGAWHWHGRLIVNDTRARNGGHYGHSNGVVVFSYISACQELYVNGFRGSRARLFLPVQHVEDNEFV